MKLKRLLQHDKTLKSDLWFHILITGCKFCNANHPSIPFTEAAVTLSIGAYYMVKLLD